MSPQKLPKMKQPSPRQLEALNAVSNGMFYPSLLKEEDGWHARWKGINDDNPWIDETVRLATMTPLSADAEFQRHETLHDAWLEALKSRTGLVVWDDNECSRFAQELDRWSGNAEDDALARSLIVFKLNTSDEHFSITCKVKRSARLLRQLGQAGYLFPSLKNLKALGSEDVDGVLLSVELSRAEAESFLRRGARDLALAGYNVEGCDILASVSASAEMDEVGEDTSSSNSFVTHLKIRVDGEDGKYLAHTLNNTVVAPPRMLIAFLENNLNEDGSVNIPVALRPYMGGVDKIVPKK